MFPEPFNIFMFIFIHKLEISKNDGGDLPRYYSKLGQIHEITV